jgi:cysteamine dioxygenase
MSFGVWLSTGAVMSSGLTQAQRRRQLAWLREVPQPKDLRIANLPYQGPKIL